MVILHIGRIVIFPVFEIVLLHRFLIDIFEFARFESPQQIPTFIETLKNSPDIIRPLTDKISLEIFQKLQIQHILCIQSLLPDNSLHSQSIFPHCIAIIKLIGHLLMVISGSSLSNGTLH